MTNIERAQREAIVGFIHRALGNMRKRVWVPDEDGDFQELPSGAVPSWWLEEQLLHELDMLGRICPKQKELCSKLIASGKTTK